MARMARGTGITSSASQPLSSPAGDHQGQAEQQRVVVDARLHEHGVHAQVAHAGDAAAPSAGAFNQMHFPAGAPPGLPLVGHNT